METTFQNFSEPFTVLNDRILWCDGDSSYTVEQLRDRILEGSKDWNNEFILDPEDFSVKKLKELSDISLVSKETLKINDNTFEWNIPENYKSLPVDIVIAKLLAIEFNEIKLSDEEKILRIDRVKDELNIWEKNNLFGLLQTLMYVVDTLKINNIIWGTGRGSSCCSYILYLIGIHDVDSVYYNLDIKDFFRT